MPFLFPVIKTCLIVNPLQYNSKTNKELISHFVHCAIYHSFVLTKHNCLDFTLYMTGKLTKQWQSCHMSVQCALPLLFSFLLTSPRCIDRLVLVQRGKHCPQWPDHCRIARRERYTSHHFSRPDDSTEVFSLAPATAFLPRTPLVAMDSKVRVPLDWRFSRVLYIPTKLHKKWK